MNGATRCAVIAGTILSLIHLAIAFAIFVSVHFSTGTHAERGAAQAEFVWFYLMWLDFPLADFAWEHLSTTRPFVAIADWGDTWGNGKNLRALFIHGFIGGIQWFILVAVLGYFLCPKSGHHLWSKN